MKFITRRTFIKKTLIVTARIGVTTSLTNKAWSKVLGTNNDIRLAIVGLGGDRIRYKYGTSFQGEGGKGSHMIKKFQNVPGVRIVALCDPDRFNLNRDSKLLFEGNQDIVKTYIDVRRLLDDKSIDAIYVATPNHWHALITIWACQSGKDVFVEKPVSWCIWEGRQMLKASRKYNRIVQSGIGTRSSDVLQQAIRYVQEGNLGKIKLARAICYRYRPSIGKVSGPQSIPETIDYDLWCGPGPNIPLMRTNLHYDWHWTWPYGNGEIGDLGSHYIDAARWALGQNELPKRTISIGNRFGYDDDGDTPNTQVTYFDYKPAPLIWEARGLPMKPDTQYMDNYKGIRRGEIIHCEGGYVAGGWAYDNEGRKIKQFVNRGGENHTENFFRAMRSRKPSDLKAEILEGHISAGLSHIGNISHRVGQETSPEEIKESIKNNSNAIEAFERMKEHLAAHEIDLSVNKAILGAWMTMDPCAEKFIGQFADKGNSMLKREQYRKPFVIPEQI